MLASRQYIELLFRDGQNSVYFAGKVGVIGTEAHWAGVHLGQDVEMMPSPFSRWSAPFNRAMLLAFLVKPAHIHGDSVRNYSGSGAPGIVRRMSSYLCTYLTWVFGDQFEFRPENQPYSSRNHRQQSPTAMHAACPQTSIGRGCD
jgi:hypothetical protein